MSVIASFGDDDTRRIWEGRHSPRLPQNIQRVARRKLLMLDAATDLRQLAAIPRNRLERLEGKLAGWWSIRINDQWRVIFLWDPPRAFEVEIVDYH